MVKKLNKTTKKEIKGRGNSGGIILYFVLMKGCFPIKHRKQQQNKAGARLIFTTWALYVSTSVSLLPHRCTGPDPACRSAPADERHGCRPSSSSPPPKSSPQTLTPARGRASWWLPASPARGHRVPEPLCRRTWRVEPSDVVKTHVVAFVSFVKLGCRAKCGHTWSSAVSSGSPLESFAPRCRQTELSGSVGLRIL